VPGAQNHPGPSQKKEKDMQFNNYVDLAFPGEEYQQKVRELREDYQPRQHDVQTEETKKSRIFDLRTLLGSLFV
jgi:hypothetical protein